MHELSIAMSLLDVATEEAERRGGVRVVAVHVKLGPLSGVVKESLLSAYDLARESSRLANSALVIEDVPVVVFCPRCSAERPIVSIQEFRCAVCGTPTAEVITGRELQLAALEIDE